MSTEWETVIGLEVHCELQTVTKLFCGCRNAFGDEPNTNICPVCLGLPGSLPVINGQAVELAMAIGTALNCEIRPSTFHRKNYFYPDQAKDYQISQYDEPINVNGHLDLPDGTTVGIERAYTSVDVLLGATAPTTAFKLGDKVDDPMAMYMNDVCTIPSNLAGHPALSLPFGTGDDGLPVGVQLLGPALSEGLLFQVAAVVEAAAPALPALELTAGVPS